LVKLIWFCACGWFCVDEGEVTMMLELRCLEACCWEECALLAVEARVFWFGVARLLVKLMPWLWYEID